MNLLATFGQQQAPVLVCARLSSCNPIPTAGRDLRQRSAHTLSYQPLRVPPLLASKQDTAEAAAAQDRLTADFGALSDKIEVGCCILRHLRLLLNPAALDRHAFPHASKGYWFDVCHVLWQELAAEVKENLQGTSLYLVGMMGRYVCTFHMSSNFMNEHHDGNVARRNLESLPSAC